MSAPAVTPSRYSKRKRAPVSYTESAIDDDDGGLDIPIPDDEEEPEFGSRKKVKKASPKTQPKKKAPRAPKPFPFMSLPPELRNQIYKLALVDPAGAHIQASKGWYHNAARHCGPTQCRPGDRVAPRKWLPDDVFELIDHRTFLVPNLLATSKAIYSEAAALFWGQHFYFADLTTMHNFLYRVRPETMTMIREATLIAWQRNHKSMSMPVSHLLGAATNLERFTIFDHVYTCSYRSQKGPAGDADRSRVVGKKLYRDFYPFIDVVIKSRGIEQLQKVFRLSDSNFLYPNYWNQREEPLTEDRRKTCEDAMFQEIARIWEHDHK